MGCGQSKTSASSSTAASSKTFNHRKPKVNDDHPNRQVVNSSNSPLLPESRSVEDKANANNTTTSTTTQGLAAAAAAGGAGGGSGGSAAVKRGYPAAAAAGVAAVKTGHGADDDIQLMDEEQMIPNSEEMLTTASGHAPLDTCCLSTNPDRCTDFYQEKQARYSTSSSSSCSSSSSSSSSSVLMGSCRTARDRPNRLTSNLSNLTASQIEFFRMVDEKIAQGKEYESEEER